MIKKEKLKISGMFCPHCEVTIAKALRAVDGVEEVSVSYEKGAAELTYDTDRTDAARIEMAVKDAGYSVSGFDFSGIFILIIIAALYVILKSLGVTDIFRVFPQAEAAAGYGSLFIVGLLTSVHCIAMCGGINLSQSTAAARGGGSVVKSNLLYNLGRVVSYTVTGSIVGAIGSAVSLGGSLKGLVALIAGALMIIMGVNMLGLLKPLRKLRLHMPKGLSAFIARHRNGSSLVIGLLNGLMPCGPLQSMQLYALYTQSAAGGALAMLVFSLGTVPLMLAFGTVSGRLNKRFASKLTRISAAIIVMMGIVMLTTGLNLSGKSSAVKLVSDNIAVSAVEDGIQTVESTADYGRYEPIRVSAGIPVKWTITVPEGKLNGCNREIIIPEYDIDIELHEGENIVEFTPEKKGRVTFTCWMGMISSYIEVQ
ncbi:MAG: sulfite exporter TauE/SafE family protein [Candidatus Ornithomonoglobus sp.]